MTLKPPNPGGRRPAPESAQSALEYELAQEKASALGRMGRRLEAALAALKAFDAQQSADAPPEDRSARDRLVAEAGVALWHFMVQRESLGLRDAGRVIRDYAVPDEVRNRMGILPAQRPRS